MARNSRSSSKTSAMMLLGAYCGQRRLLDYDAMRCGNGTGRRRVAETAQTGAKTIRRQKNGRL